MRERLTVAFVVLTIVLLLGAGIVRSYVLRDLIREQEASHLQQEAAPDRRDRRRPPGGRRHASTRRSSSRW